MKTIQPQLVVHTPGEEIKKTILEIVMIVVCVFLFVQFIAQTVVVKGSSMNNTYFNNDLLMMEKVSYRFKAPKRGDVVVVKYPDQKDYRIKRVIAVPGDKIKTVNGSVYVNGEKLDEPYTHEGARTYGVKSEITLEEGYYFVMGDNRENSVDSRDPDVGPIPINNIIGKVFVRLVSIAKLRN